MSRVPLATVGALVVSPADKLLFVKTHKWKGSWGVPGGKVGYGESLREALQREFLEETGLRIDDIHWGPVQEAVETEEFYQPAHFILLNFIARSDSEEVILNEEAEAYAWVEVGAADGYSLNTPTRLLLEFYRRHGFGTAELA